MSWQSWIPIAAGIALAPFTGGASIPMGAAISSDMNARETADKAQQAQQAGTDKAQAAIDRGYADAKGYMQPYVDAGSAAQTTLSGLLGLPMGAGGGTSAPLPAPTATGRHMTPTSAPTGTYAVPRGTTTADQPSRGITLSGLQQTARQQTQSGYGSGMTKIKAPNGNVYLVPQSKAAEAVANGGQVVA